MKKKFNRKKYSHLYYLQHKKEIILNSKKFALKNPEKVKQYKKKHQETETYKEKQKLYRKTHELKLKKYHKNYTKKFRKQLNEKRKIYRHFKSKTDIKYKLECILRHRLYSVVKFNYKTKSVLKLLGCSVEFLKLWLELQFKEGMTWDNYGFYGWHIDHIRPCASFDLSIPEQQEACFHFTNLQPLWALENYIKRDKILETV